MPDYEKNDPRGWCGDPLRGAALGRGPNRVDPDFDGEVTVMRVAMDDEGVNADDPGCGAYDHLGTYWGHGPPLYFITSEDGEVEMMLRASDAQAAVRQARKECPAAHFVISPELTDGTENCYDSAEVPDA
jgi:hypothetical protein